MKGLQPISMKDFVDKFNSKEHIRIEVKEALVHLKEVVYKYNNPCPFNPPPEGRASFYFFYNHVINPDDYIRPFKSLPTGNLLSVVSEI